LTRPMAGYLPVRLASTDLRRSKYCGSCFVIVWRTMNWASFGTLAQTTKYL
jgi:hypothetical protein